MDENKVFKVQNAFIDETINEGAFVNGKTNIVYAGRFENQKNILKTAEFLSHYIEDRENVMVHFFGNGTLEQELRAYFSNCIGSSVVIRPFEDRIVDYFSSADIFISLSNYEGMPNSVVENAALGTKMLLSDIPEHKAIVGDNYTFLLPLNFTYEQARNLLDQLIETPSKEVQYEHINSILAEASMELVSKKYADIFRSVTGLE
jgi:glycosyltransferase involved in cell wall biosynthesis